MFIVRSRYNKTIEFGFLLGLLSLFSALIFAADFTSTSSPTSIVVPDTNEQLTFTVNNTNASVNITEVNITLANGFTFLDGSNSTTASSTTFSNATTVLTWTNASVGGFIANGGSQNFTFNVSAPNWAANHIFTVTTVDSDGTPNSTNVTISTDMPFSIGINQWSGLAEPSVNITNTTDRFFYDGNAVFVVSNFTNAKGGVTNLTVTGNFSSVGGSESRTAVNAGSGIYVLNDTVNFSALSSVNDIQPVNITVSASNGSVVNYTAWGVLINMGYPACPPNGETPGGGWPTVPGWNASGNGSQVSTPIVTTGCSTNTTLCANTDTYGPGAWNGTNWLVCSPSFGGDTTNFSIIADTGNFSAVPLVLDLPGKVKINFTSTIDFGSQQMAQAIMEVGMKNLFAGGRLGINDSEWSGENNKPNLTLSAALTLYNLTSLIGVSDPYIRFGSFNGSNNPGSLSTCPATRCSGISWDGENLTFTVSTFSTYVIGNTTHSLLFENLSALSSTVVTNQNASYSINITNNGNATQETYNLSVTGFGTLDTSSITLNQSESVTVVLNVSNSSASSGLTSVIVATHWNGTGNDAVNLNSSEDSVTFDTTVATPSITINLPTASQNMTSTSGVAFNFSDNTNLNTSQCVIQLNGSTLSGVACANQTIGASNFTAALNQNLTIIGNDTYGNTNISTTVTFNIDNTAPEVTSITLPAASVNVSGTLTVNATATDAGTGVQTVEFNLSNSTGSVVNVTTMTTWGVAGNYTGNVSTTGFTDGTYTITLIAIDYSSNSNTSQSTNITVDNTAPVVSIVTPSTTTYAEQVLTVNASVTDAIAGVDTVRYNVSNSSWSSVVVMTLNGSNYNASLNLSTLVDGNYTVTILSNDTAGNTNNTENVVITVDKTDPQLSLWNYSFVTKQLTLQFSEIVDVGSIDLSGFNVTYNDGSVATGLQGLSGATVHSTSNTTVIVVNLTTAMDVAMQNLKELTQGQIDMVAGAINDTVANGASESLNVVYGTYSIYGIEIDLSASTWSSFNLPRTILENRSSLSSNYTVLSVLSSISGNYALIYYYDGSSWTSYVPGRETNDFTTFTDDTGTNRYWVYMNATDKLQIV